MRKKYPKDQVIYLVLDNFSPHRRQEIRRWARTYNVRLVWTPTNASWLNRIECQFTELKTFAINNEFYKTHKEMQKAIRKFLRYRNKRNRENST
jgi:transposase